MAEATYHAPAIHCEGCAASIQRSLGKLAGVESVDVDITSKQVIVRYDPSRVDDGAIRRRLELAGFPVGNPGA